ncbi:MAG: glycosyl hydrolase family 28 protein [Clostridiales bacterium]|nr:glycosyl hydrolase family 28 protein [Clostridiales bacterium]
MNYKVSKNGVPIKVRSCRIFPKPYNGFSRMEYVLLEANEKTVLTVESEQKIESAVIRPKSKNIPVKTENGRAYVYLDGPAKLSLEINGRCENNLMIFAGSEGENDIPRAKNLIVIKNDRKSVGTIRVSEDDSAVYFEEDAVLEGNIIAENCKNLTICGKGKICMERYSYEMRPDFARSIDIRGCKNVSIYGIIIDDSNDWSMRITGCDDVNIRDVKIFGCRGNSDGIDICGSRNVTVSDIFTRVWDDSFVVKALGEGNTENVVFKNSVLWNDFARPMEVGVELRADRVRNIRFENIDIIHSSTGYPLMGIHHGDHAKVSDIVFDNIRIEDTPGAQLFDIRIADSVWSRDNAMGSISDITFSDIEYTSEGDILLSNSRVEGFCGEHDVKNVLFKNISVNGKRANTPKALGLDICGFAENIRVEGEGEEIAAKAECSISASAKPIPGGRYISRVLVRLENKSGRRLLGTASLAVSPKNTEREREFAYDLLPGQSSEYEFELKLAPGKYVFFIKNKENEIENKWFYTQLEAVVYDKEDISRCPVYEFVNYYDMRRAAVRFSVSDDKLIIMSETPGRGDFVLYTAMPAKMREGEVMFSAEETDFGEVCALVNRNGAPAAAPQLRCPAEITYVFKNEPKVEKTVKTHLHLGCGESVEIPFDKLGIDKDADSFIMEIEAKKTEGLRYPYTLFHSTAPEKTAHMFGLIKIKKGKEKQC